SPPGPASGMRRERPITCSPVGESPHNLTARDFAPGRATAGTSQLHPSRPRGRTRQLAAGAKSRDDLLALPPAPQGRRSVPRVPSDLVPPDTNRMTQPLSASCVSALTSHARLLEGGPDCSLRILPVSQRRCIALASAALLRPPTLESLTNTCGA